MWSFQWFSLGYICFLIFFFPSVSFAQNDVRDLVRQAKPAVVTIAVYDSAGRMYGQGSGFFIDGDHIITSRHVVESAHRAEYRLGSGEIYPVLGVIGDDLFADLAKLQVRQPQGRVTPLSLAPGIPEEGEPVIAIGSPQGLELTVSEGIVASIREHPTATRLLQITAPISPGSSGGPILNGAGEVVGVASWVLAAGQNLNFAVPVDNIRALSDKELRTFDQWRATANNLVAALSALPRPKEFVDNPEAAHAMAQYTMALAVEHMQHGRHESAIQLLTMALSLEPDNGEAWFFYGIEEASAGHYEPAVEALQQAVHLMPGHVPAHVGLGDALSGLQQHEKAIRSFKEALNLDSTYGRAWSGIGISYYAQGRDSAALQALSQSLLYDTTISETWYVLGKLYRRWGHLAEAERAFRRVIRMEPQALVPYHELAAFLMNQERFADAVPVWREMTKLSPDDPSLLRKLGLALQRSGKPEDAVDVLLRSIEMRSDDDTAHYILATVYIDLGKFDKGKQEIIEAIRCNPDLAQAHHALGMFYLEYEKNKAAALDQYRILQKLNPDFAQKLFDKMYR